MIQFVKLGALGLASVAAISTALVVGGVVPPNRVAAITDGIPLLSRPDTASKPASPPSTETENSASDQDKSTATQPVEAAKVEAEPAETEQQPSDPKLPAFDILRLEPDGSLVVAGQSQPDLKVELLDSAGRSIGSDMARSGGDFLIVPDRELPPGDHVLRLVITSKDGRRLSSAETGVLRVPEPGKKDLLAMVTRENAPSRILSKPPQLQPDETPKGEEVEVAALSPQARKPASVVDAPTSDQAQTEDEPVIPSTQDETAAAEENALSTAEVTSPEAEVSAPEQDEISSGEQKQTATSTGERETASEPSVGQVDEPKQAEPSTEVAALAPAENPTAGDGDQSSPQVTIEAIEIEGDRLFIAGAVSPNRTVRLYMNGEPIGDARGTADGRFLLSRPYELRAGEHDVRVDVIGPSDGNVVARAAVQLLHEPQPAELAKAEPAPEPVSQSEATPAAQAGADESVAQLDSERVSAETEQTDEQAVQNTVTATEAATPSAASAKTSAVEDSASQATRDVAAVDDAQRQGIVPEKQLREPYRATRAPGDIIRTGSAVIIKPGDNLWRISRKTYGRGIRYTTIFQANRDQIRDPNRIYIGQIFKLPSAGLDTAIE